MEILVVLLIGLVAGVLSGMFGIGGGIVIVPALIVLASFSLPMASGTSLAALLLPVGIFACLQYYKAGYLSIKTSGVIALGLLGGVYFGAELALSMDQTILKMIYGMFLLYVSWLFIDIPELLKFKKAIAEPAEDEKNKNVNLSLLLALGLFAGLLSGLFGIGGGIVITPFLMTVFKFHPKKAIGTSLGALLLPVGLPGVIVYNQAGNLNLTYGAMIALGIVFGAIVGAKITISLPAKKVKRIYGIFVFLLSLDFIFNGYFAR